MINSLGKRSKHGAAVRAASAAPAGSVTASASDKLPQRVLGVTAVDDEFRAQTSEPPRGHHRWRCTRSALAEILPPVTAGQFLQGGAVELAGVDCSHPAGRDGD